MVNRVKAARAFAQWGLTNRLEARRSSTRFSMGFQQPA